jgi:TolA-binding protein
LSEAPALVPPAGGGQGNAVGEEPGVPAGAASGKPAQTAEGGTGKSQPPGKTPGWKAFIEQGKYAEAMKDAEEEGFEALVEKLPLSDLWLLANAARYAGDDAKAKKALTAVRGRFGKSKLAKVAAFLLGRIALESDKDPAAGERWLETYLAEDPGGPLAEEALGRLIDARVKAGHTKDAREAGAAYLQKYPDGIFAELARSVLKK